MSDGSEAADAGWFAGREPGDGEPSRAAIREGTASEPGDWPRLAVESGAVASEAAYYEWLHEVTVQTVREEVRQRQRADDQQLIHAVRAMDE